MTTRSTLAWALPAAMAFLSLPGAGQTNGIPRMPDGKPNFNGVWAGPAFAHNVGPNDTDTPVVTNFVKTEGQIVITVTNAHATLALNGTLKLDFIVIN